MLIEEDGQTFSTLLGSDLERDGMFLELRSSALPEPVMEAFYSDEDGHFSVRGFGAAVPITVMEAFLTEARLRLPHSEGKKRAVFLDRDGVINRPVVREGKPYPPASVEEFELLPGVEEACARLKAAGYLLVVATNQPDVGRGTQRQEEVEAMHARMEEQLPLDRIEVSYDPGQGQPSEFRKPAPGMLLRAARELEIDLAKSWMVGDRWRDVDCGAAAGCRTVFIDYGYDEKLRVQPDFRAASLSEAVEVIVRADEK